MKHKQIISIATFALLSFHSTHCFALGKESTPRHSHTTQTLAIAKEHIRLSDAATAMKAQHKASQKASSREVKLKRDTSRDGLNKFRADHVSKLIEFRGDTVKAHVKKLSKNPRYTEEQQNKDVDQIEALKVQYINNQNINNQNKK
jgi:hypothetical protein